MVNVVPVGTVKTVEPDGMPAPDTNMPTVMFVVSGTVTVVDAATVAPVTGTPVLLPRMFNAAIKIEQMRMGINYGLNKVRFPAPVPVDSRLRCRIKLLACEPVAGDGLQLTWDMLKNEYGRNGIDGRGKATYSRVHYSSNYVNAFCSDSCFCMTYGDGSTSQGFKTLTSLDVAAHEMGHAMQHSIGYGPLRLRSAIIPAVQFGSSLAPILFIIGFLLNFTTLAWVGVILFGVAVLFSLITLPVEFDASKRAKVLLNQSGVMSAQELQGVDKVLDAAALTYVAAAVAAIGQLVYYVLLLTGGRRD